MGTQHEHATGVEDWQGTLRSEGYRLTPQRQLVLEAVRALGHATPDDVLRRVQERASGVNASTVYRTLEVLEKTGLVSHAHLGHGAPTYHPTTTPAHVHLVCRSCSRVGEVDPHLADAFATALDEAEGFAIDVRHLTAFGKCAECRREDL